MTVVLWRIGTEAPDFSAIDLSGAGARKSGGRRNSPGTPMLYSSVNIALATLETLSHIRSGSLPFNRYLVRIDIPDEVWRRRTVLKPLPGGWDAIPFGLAGRHAGDAWAARNRSALLQVPSVIVPEEANILINPAHPDIGKISAVALKRWIADPRFF